MLGSCCGSEVKTGSHHSMLRKTEGLVRWFSSIAIGLAACVVGFGVGYLARPSLDSSYIQLLDDPGYFGQYFRKPGTNGWLIIELDVINERIGTFSP